MKKKIFFVVVFSLLSLFANRAVQAQDVIPVITYTINGNSADTITNPKNNPVELGFVSEVNIENWVSITIKNKEDPSIYKTFQPGALCDGNSECNQHWEGEISPSDKTLVDGIYNIIVHIKNTTGITFDLTLVSPYIIQVDTSTPPDTTAPIITLNGDAFVNLNVNDSYEDLGSTASDDVDGILTDLIIIKGVDLVDTSVAGTYTITYDVKDEAGNSATQVVRTINVTEKDTGTGTDTETTISNENIKIRNGDSIIYEGVIPLPDAGIIDIGGHEVDTQSVLGILYALDQKEDKFSITDISYNDSYKSFLLNCITPSEGESLCYNWNYVVNGSYPIIGMDKNIITGENNIYLYFGQPSKILLSSNSINNNESLIVTVQEYNYEDNTWSKRTGITVGVIQPNPVDFLNPIEIQKGLVDEKGQITFSSIPIGSYGVGVKEDYYWPQENLEVKNISSGGGGGGSVPEEKTFSIPNALSFLSSQQKEDGSFGSSLYTDWAAIAISSGDNVDIKSKITKYLKNKSLISSIVTDYERYAMALMSLGINPYSGTSINCIKKITDSFDGAQIGDESLFNDDIFGLIVLSKASYSKSDEIIQKDIEYIISKQSPSDGSWGSVDMTAAGIEALGNFKDISGVKESISKGELYLKNEQQNDGGFKNSSSTSWAIQALSLNNSYENEVNNAIKYLANSQQNDGGLDGSDIDNRIWTTSYAIPAAGKLSWNNILESFEKPEEPSTITNSGTTISTPEAVLPIVETPIVLSNPNLALAEDIVEKKVPKASSHANSIIKPIVTQDLQNPITKTSFENNLGASAGNAVHTEILSNTMQKILDKIINFFAYIGKSFCGLVISLFNL